MSITYEAHLLAKKYHEGQLYGDVPYLDHLYAVAESAAENYHKCAEDQIFAIGLLHDILEDTACTREELLEIFGIDITRAVIALSKFKGETYTDYILKVRENAWALHVKTHDTLCNLTESVKQGDKRRILKYSRQLILLTEEL